MNKTSVLIKTCTFMDWHIVAIFIYYLNYSSANHNTGFGRKFSNYAMMCGKLERVPLLSWIWTNFLQVHFSLDFPQYFDQWKFSLKKSMSNNCWAWQSKCLSIIKYVLMEFLRREIIPDWTVNRFLWAYIFVFKIFYYISIYIRVVVSLSSIDCSSYNIIKYSNNSYPTICSMGFRYSASLLKLNNDYFRSIHMFTSFFFI